MEMIQKTQQAIDLDDDNFWVADSALYTEENIKLMGTETKWITHMPATVAEAQELLNSDLNMIPGSDPRYAFYATEINYGGVPQRAVVVWSKEMNERNEKTFERRIEKETIEAGKDLKKLMRKKFACIPDADNDLRLWQSSHPHHMLKNVQVVPVMEKAEKKRGRPKKDELLTASYMIQGEIKLNEEALIEARKNLGRFVLASNQVDLDPEVMLNYYKGQQAVERGFRFLKDKSFHVSEVYLKKEERIEALCMIMVLSLLIYSFAEWKLRKELKKTGQTVPNQLNKPTQRPTMRWVFEIFMGVIASVVMDGETIIKTVIHLSDPQTTILELLGSECKKYYVME